MHKTGTPRPLPHKGRLRRCFRGAVATAPSRVTLRNSYSGMGASLGERWAMGGLF